MRVERFAPSEYGTPGGWRIHDWQTVDELLEFRDRQRREKPELQLLYILDDQAQAEYTSMHAVESLELATPDKDGMSADEWHQYEHELKLTPECWAATVTRQLLRQSKVASLGDERGRLVPIEGEDIRLLDLYAEPERVFIVPLTCLAVPADEPSMAIAAQPNGYFEGDLTPSENYLLAEMLRERFGYEVLGLGSLLGAYVRSAPFSEVEMTEVVSSVRHLYDEMTDDLATAWAKKAAGRRWFLLHYCGS